MGPLRFELASKTGRKEVWDGSHFRARTLADSLQTSCTLASRVGSKPAGFAAPVGAVLCTRRLHNCRRRTGEKILEGYGLFECAFHCNLHVYNLFIYIDCGNKSTGLTVFTQYIVSYFTFRHSPEQAYRPIRPQSLRLLYQLSTRFDCNWIWQMNDVHL